MSLPNLVPFCTQAGVLAGLVLSVLLVLGVAGLGLVVGLLPRFFQLRWVVFAPLAGLAVIPLVSLPLALLGLPARTYAWPLLLGLTAVSTGGALRAFQSAGSLRRRRLAGAFLRRSWSWLLLGFVAVVLLAAGLITNHSRSRVDAVWGSYDFGSYWTVAAYLQDHGADPANYPVQTQYHADDIRDHLLRHARLGCMTTLACLGQIIAPGRLAALLNPLLVAALWLMVALAQVFARRERLWPVTGLLMVGSHPFVYFLLFYSYHSQAFSVLLVVAGLMVAELSGRSDSPLAGMKGSIAAGLFFAAAILQYPSAVLAPGFYLAATLVGRGCRPHLASALVCGAVMLVATGYYLPQTWRELTWLRQATILPGWDWQRLVDIHELLGLRSLTVFDPLPPGGLGSTGVTLAITGLFGAALLIHLRKGALPRTSVALLGSTGLLAAAGYLKFLHGAPHATHAIAKAVSQYAPFLVVFGVAGAVAAFAAPRRKIQGLALAVVAGFALIQFLQVSRWRQAPWFDYDLITLVERHTSTTLPLAFDPGLDRHFVDPLVKDDRRLAPAGFAGPRLHFTLASRRSTLPGYTLVDEQGAYVALQGPTAPRSP